MALSTGGTHYSELADPGAEAFVAEPLRISFHGAAGTVTGSKFLLEAAGRRILIDAGLFQGRKDLRLLNWSGPAFDPAAVDHVLLTHTHIDHIGYLPRLVKLGLSAPVHCTRAARQLARLMLLDAAKLQEEDARYANKKGFSRHRPALPLYRTRDAKRALALLRETPFRRLVPLDGSGDLSAMLHNAGHILGSAFVEVRLRWRGRDVRIVFSGDVGRFDIPLHVDPRPLPRCDLLVIESTYGDRRHTARSLLEQVGGALRATLRRGGIVLVPAFAVGRSQQVTWILRRLMRAGALPDVPIHIDSPMAVDATRVYSRFLDRANLDPDVYEDGRLRLFPHRVSFHRTRAESKRLNRLEGPRVIVSASGMLTGGRVLHHLRRLAPDPRNLILLAGYQAEGTRGRRLVEGEREIKVHGEMVPVRAKVVQLHGLSGHADRDELERWVRSAPVKPRLAFVVHGEPGPAAAFARRLERLHGIPAHTPGLGETFDLARFLEEGALNPAPRAGGRSSGASDAR
ncbi:MAG: MBL fold metallo-hydrolase [Acidobacteria bacterium]|nr:MAG: MBL fold metallo-hydrolase [Acidobacteriota bacterium]